MPFSNNVRPDRMPGPINGNPAQGLCERACIQVTKVFDACIKQETLPQQMLLVTDITPSTVSEPYTFVSARSTSQGTITNTTLTTLDERTGATRIQLEINLPMQVLFSDATNTSATGNSSISLSRDIVLNIPQASVFPYRIEAVCSAVSTVGAYVGDNTFSATVCVSVIVKVVTDVELLVPTYGYCYIPPCQEFQQEVCEGFFDLPLFPQS